MRYALLYSPWGAFGRGMAPQVSIDYTLVRCEQQDANDPPTPCLVEILCTNAIWALIAADPVYSGGIVNSWAA